MIRLPPAAGWELAHRVGLSGPHELFGEVFDDAGSSAWLQKLTEDDAEAFARWITAVDQLDQLLDVDIRRVVDAAQAPAALHDYQTGCVTEFGVERTQAPWVSCHLAPT